MEIEEIRQKLDGIDAQIMSLIAKRMSYMPKIAEFKRKAGIPVEDSAREESVLKKAHELAKAEGISEELAEHIMKAIIKHARKLQQERLDAEDE